MKPKRTKQVIGMVVGGVMLLLSPIIARWQYVIAIQRAYTTIESSYHQSPTATDPHQLSGNIDAVLYACAGGLFGSIVGLIVLVL